MPCSYLSLQGKIVKEITGNLWNYHNKNDYAICITTNAIVKDSGDLVCGAGCAKEACQRTNFARLAGLQVFAWGNHVYHITDNIFTFPVKRHYANKAKLSIIENSCKELVDIMNKDKYKNRYKKIVLPRPGCGNGKLNWEEVRLILEKYLDNRFLVISK